MGRSPVHHVASSRDGTAKVLMPSRLFIWIDQMFNVLLLLACKDVLHLCFVVQLLLRLEDDRLVETVGIPLKDREGASRLTACVSSQVNDRGLLLHTAFGRFSWYDMLFNQFSVSILYFQACSMLGCYLLSESRH